MDGGAGTGRWRLRAQGPAWLLGHLMAYLVLEQDDELRAQDQALEPSWLHKRCLICRSPGTHPPVWATGRQRQDSRGLQPGSRVMPAALEH